MGMFVRVFDAQRNTYFKSEVYAVINGGWYEKRLVVFSSGDDRYFKFFDYLDKSNPTSPEALINTIVSSGFTYDPEWIFKQSSGPDKKLEDYEELLSSDIRFFEYIGCSWIYENRPLLAELLGGDAVSTKEYEHLMLAPNAHQLEGWHYVEEQQDVDFLLEQTGGFHDSVLKELSYVSGAFVDEKKSMYCTDSVRSVTMRFDSQWCRPIEMIFEGVVALNLRPCQDNYTSEIYKASLLLQNASIFFCDGMMDNIDKDYAGTWIESFSLRWRFCE